MAGERHHFLPRFLLKGFAAETVRDEVYAWMFRRDSEPFETNIKNMAVQRFFYGKPEEDSFADEAITEVE